MVDPCGDIESRAEAATRVLPLGVEAKLACEYPAGTLLLAGAVVDLLDFFRFRRLLLQAVVAVVVVLPADRRLPGEVRAGLSFSQSPSSFFRVASFNVTVLSECRRLVTKNRVEKSGLHTLKTAVTNVS